jgi:hypothetical protein
MNKENMIEVGNEVMLDGVVWAIVEEVERLSLRVGNVLRDEFFIVDEDGAGHVVTADRLDIV